MFKKSTHGWLKHYDFILLDLICLELSFILAYGLRHSSFNPFISSIYRNIGWTLFFVDIGVIFFNETFKGVLKRGYYRELAITVRHAFILILVVALYLFSVRIGSDVSRTVLFSTMIIYVTSSYFVRLLYKSILRKHMVANAGKRSLLIVTTSDIANEVVSNIKYYNYEMFYITGVVLMDKDNVTGEVEGVPVVANKDTAVDYVCKEWVDEVFINLSKEHVLSQEIVEEFAETGVTVHLNLAGIINPNGRKQLVEKVGKYTVLTTGMNYLTPRQAFFKRTMDIVGSIVGLFFTGIIFIFVAPMIYKESPGPIFYSQTRVGKNGKLFKMYKFRSMYLDADERKKELMKYNKVNDPRMFKMDFDPRVIGNKILPNGEHKTGIGEFIRKTSLDEFPQFWNVLKGECSLVGTRPPLIDEVELYAPHHRARLAVKPGITGMWQVSGRSDITDFE